MHRRRRARPARLLDVLAIGLALVGLAALAGAARAALVSPAGPPVHVTGELSHPSGSAPTVTAGPGSTSRDAPASPRRTAPAALAIPSIGVRTGLVRLGLNPDGTLQVPSDVSVAGWYALGPGPGQPGAAVIAGHVDSKEGPAVFYRLGELATGALIRITLVDGRHVAFRVYAVREYAKTAFPTALVYGPTAAPELRLVTCGGPFDARTGHYLDNVVVFARSAAMNGAVR
jgi:hypothetical protein